MDAASSPLETLPLGQFLDRAGSKTPTPGGGSMSALCGACGAAMALMAARYSAGKQPDAAAETSLTESIDALARCDRMFRRLAQEDAEAYLHLREAIEAVKQDPARSAQREAAGQVALAVPLEIVTTAGIALQLVDAVQPHVTKFLISDLGVSAVLLEASARAGAYNVRINVQDIDAAQRDEVLSLLQDMLSRAGRTLQNIVAAIDRRIGEPAR